MQRLTALDDITNSIAAAKFSQTTAAKTSCTSTSWSRDKDLGNRPDSKMQIYEISLIGSMIYFSNPVRIKYHIFIVHQPAIGDYHLRQSSKTDRPGPQR